MFGPMGLGLEGEGDCRPLGCLSRTPRPPPPPSNGPPGRSRFSPASAVRRRAGLVWPEGSAGEGGLSGEAAAKPGRRLGAHRPTAHPGVHCHAGLDGLRRRQPCLCKHTRTRRAHTHTQMHVRNMHPHTHTYTQMHVKTMHTANACTVNTHTHRCIHACTGACETSLAVACPG